MRLLFFPGCLIPARYPQMEAAIRKTVPKLGIEIVDNSRFTCCPDPIHFKPKHKLNWLTLAARNLAVAEQDGLDVFTICSGCTATLSETWHLLHEDEVLRDHVNKRLKKIGLEYKGTSRVRHIVTVIREDIGISAVKKSVTRPLEGIDITIHYGCHLLKPSKIMNVDDPDDPKIMDELISALGANPVHHKNRLLCCGKSCMDEELPDRMTRDVLSSVSDTGTELMGMICPSCFSSFDQGQVRLSKKFDINFNVAPVYYFQLLGLAQGLTPKEVGINRHAIKPTKLLGLVG